MRRPTVWAIAEWFKDTPVGSPRQCTDFVGQWREELLASCGRNFIEDQLAEGQLAIEAWSLRGLPRPPPQDRRFPLRVSCEYSGRAGGRCGDSASISRLGGLSALGALHYQSVFCLSFATLPVFLDKIHAFDFTPAKTRLSVRRTGADGQSF